MPEPRAPLSPSGVYLPDAASNEPAWPPGPSGSLFAPTSPKAPDERQGSTRRADSLSPSGSWFTPKTLAPEPQPLKPPAAEVPSASTDTASTEKVTADKVTTSESGSAWTADPLSPTGSVFKLKPDDRDRPQGQPARAEQLDWTRPLMAALPGDEEETSADQAVGNNVAPAAGSWSASSLGISPGRDAGGVAGGSGGRSGDPRGGQAGSAGRPNRRKRTTIVGIAAALVVLAGAGGVYYYSTVSKGNAAHAADKAKGKRKIVTTLARGPEHVLSMTPADGSTGVNGAADIKVVFSEPLSPTSPMPRLHPKIRGSWHVSGATAVFVPKRAYWQHTKVKITVPAGATGIQSNGGGQLAARVKATFKTGSFTVARLEQDLTQLGYLPLTWAPATGTPAALTDLNAQYSAAYNPPQGNYTWQPGYPSMLMNMWRPDAPSNILRGAVAAFQADHGLMLDMITENQYGLIVNGPIGYRLWHAMFRALAHQDANKHGYTYAVANQHSPETLTVWHNGHVIFHHLANTGIPIRPTAVRTDPVYIRFRTQIMKGRNPDGSKYADPVAWVAYFHGGEAVHYFPRYSYGSQQSLGCVELPYRPAERIWPYLTYGTLVTVTKV